MSHGWPLGLKIVLPFALVFAVIGVVLGVQNAYSQNHQQQAASVRTVQSDLAGCVRGNALRSQTKDGFVAVDDAIRGLLDQFLTPRTPDQQAIVDQFRSRLTGPLGRLDQAQAKIPIIDCLAVTPGVDTLTPEQRDEALRPTTTTTGG